MRMAGHAAGKTAGRSLGSKLLGTAATKAITAIVALAVVATGTFAIAAATGHNPFAGASQKPANHSGAGGAPSPTATPPPPSEVTYIGGGGNIWEMTLPGGTPKQLTSDAKAGNPNTGVGSISYYGLAWSPDGSMLATVRAVGVSGFPGSNAELRVLAPDGSLMWKQALAQPPINGTLAWSPDSRFIAYRQGTSNFDANGDEQGNLVIVDAHTGAATSTLKYNAGGVGCGGGGYSPLELLIWSAHHAYTGIDSFAWSSDGQELLVSSGCADQEAAAVARSSGATTAGYPAGASFQPGGQLILGTAAGNAGVVLELTNLAGQQSRVLASISGPSGSSSYADGLGQGTWSSDGKTIYYEYQDGIWRVNADGSGAQQIIAGTQATNGQATVGLVPRLSPDGKRLLYLQAHGDWGTTTGTATAQWYIAQADGSGAQALPNGAVDAQHSIFEAVWRPGR